MSAQLQSLPELFNARARREGWPTASDDRLVFDNPRLNDLVGVWQAVRGSRSLPLRADFTARALVRHLRDVAFAECVREPGTARRLRFGYYGSGLARYSGDCTGKFHDEVIPAQFITSWYASFDLVLELAAPLRFVSQIRAFNLEYMTAESLVAPLGDANGVPCGFLVSATYTPRVS